MASTPSNRLKLTPSNSPFHLRLSRSPIRSRTTNDVSSAASLPPRLSLKRVIGSTCSSPTGFDAVHSTFAYIAGGAVVVVSVRGNRYRQRFYRARPTAVPVYAVSPVPHAPSTPTSTPKANDSRNRASLAAIGRDSTFGISDWTESPTSGKTWTQRERIKSATCVALSRDGRFLAVGETGYAPRVLIFSLDDASSDTPLVSISEHSFGVKAVAWSADSRYLASLGTANDGFLYLWKIDPRTGAAKLFQQNRCTSYVRGMIWLSNATLVTFGVRHIKAWRVDDGSLASSPFAGSSGNGISPTKSRYTMGGDSGFPSPLSSHPPAFQQQGLQQQQQQKTLPGRNILLGSLLDATFSCAAPLPGGRALICSEAGDICLLESAGKQMKLVALRDVGFSVSCLCVRDGRVYIGAKSGLSMAVDLDDLLSPTDTETSRGRQAGSSSSGSTAWSGTGAVSPTTPCSSVSSISGSNNTGHAHAGPRFSLLRPTSSAADAHRGLVAMGFLSDHVVAVDAKQSIEIFFDVDHVPGTRPAPNVKSIPIPAHGEPILGVQALTRPNAANAAFFTWSSSGAVLLWNMRGEIRASLQVPVEQILPENELDMANQLTVVRATRDVKLFVAADRLGVLRVMDFETGKFLLETKAHASECQSITLYEDETEDAADENDNKQHRFLLATSGRDRTAQLFHRRRSDGVIEHFQTLEFAAKVVQVLLTPDDKVITCSFDRTMQIHDLVFKEDDPDAIAAIPARVITLKASPSSMVLAPGATSVYVALLDRTVCQYDLATGKLLSTFKCIDEGGTETAMLDSLIYAKQTTTAVGAIASTNASSVSADAAFLLGLSNTDKSVRIYDAQTGVFLGREWGHTEAINGVALVEEQESAGKDEGETTGEDEDSDSSQEGPDGRVGRKVVSVGSDGTIMIWSLDLQDAARPGTGIAGDRDISPTKDSNVTVAAGRPPLRRVLSKAELAEFQRGSATANSGGSSATTNSNAAGGSATNSSTGSTGSAVGSTTGRRSPVRSISRKTSRFNLSFNGSNTISGSGSGPARTPISVLLNGPGNAMAEKKQQRRASAGSGSGSPPPPPSPKAKVRRRPSLPALNSTSASGSGSPSLGSTGGGTASASASATSTAAAGASGSGPVPRKKTSINSLRSSYGFGSLSMATEQTCRQLRAYRKRLASTDPIALDVLVELDQELRLTVAALGDRAIRSKAVSDELDGLLDEKLDKLVSMLDEKLRLQRRQEDSQTGKKTKTTGAAAATATATATASGTASGTASTATTTTPSKGKENQQPASETPGSVPGSGRRRFHHMRHHSRDGSNDSAGSEGSRSSAASVGQKATVSSAAKATVAAATKTTAPSGGTTGADRSTSSSTSTSTSSAASANKNSKTATLRAKKL